jgi:hypothetical protein
MQTEKWKELDFFPPFKNVYWHLNGEIEDERLVSVGLEAVDVSENIVILSHIHNPNRFTHEKLCNRYDKTHRKSIWVSVSVLLLIALSRINIEQVSKKMLIMVNSQFFQNRYFLIPQNQEFCCMHSFGSG